VAGIASLAAAYLAEHYHAPIMLMGLLFGLAFNFLNVDRRLHAGLAFASNKLLRWGIILVGLQVTLAQIVGLGWPALGAIAAMIALVMLCGTLTARFAGLEPSFGTLAGGAVGICGASAAMALAAVLGEKRVNQAQLTLVLVTVSAASALAMSLYPVLAHSLHLTDKQAGFLMGASIHDVAQALGAGYSYSPLAGQTASIVKLTRVALLAPVLVLVSMHYTPRGQSRFANITIPWFVLGFALMAVAHSLVTLPPVVMLWAPRLSTALLLIAVTSTGIRSPLTLLLDQGWRPSLAVIVSTLVSFLLALGASLWLA